MNAPARDWWCASQGNASSIPGRDNANPDAKANTQRFAVSSYPSLIPSSIAVVIPPSRRHRRRRVSSFNFDAKRRREIERHAKHIGAAETEDFDRWLICWVWHNPRSTDPIAALQNAAEVMGGKLSNAEAEDILKQAETIPRRRTADRLGKWLGLTYCHREKLKITTIGTKDIGKRARKGLRKRANRLYQEKRRRERGARPQAESLSKTKPWLAQGISRRTWERHGNKARDAISEATLDATSKASGETILKANDATKKAALLYSAHDGLASARPEVGPALAGATVASSLPSLLVSSRKATLPAADRLAVFRPGWQRDKLCGELQSPQAVVTIREVWPPALGPAGDDVFALVDGGGQ
jgi:hypothetical protein